MSGSRLKAAFAVAAALAAAIAIVQSVDRPDAPKSETPGQTTSRSAAAANRSDPEVVVARGAADSRPAHAPFVEASPEAEPGSGSDAETRPTPPPDARRIVVEAVFEDGDPVVGCVVEAAPLEEGERFSAIEPAERADERQPGWLQWDDRLLQARLDERGRAELFVPPHGWFVVQSPAAFLNSDSFPAEWADGVPFRSRVVASNVSTVRIVVRAFPLAMTVHDQHGRPVVRRPFMDATYAVHAGELRFTDADGRVRFHGDRPGPMKISDLGESAERRLSLRSERQNEARLKRLGPLWTEKSSYFVDEVRIDGKRVDSSFGIRADAPGEVFVRMRTLPVAVVRVVDADGRAEGLADVRLDVGFAGKPYRFTLDEGRPEPDGRAAVKVPCDGRTLAVDAPLSTLRWRIRSPNGREERIVEIPVSPDDTLVDAGTVKLASHRTWKLRLFDAEGRALSGRDVILASIPAEGADPKAECVLEDRSTEFESNAEATIVHPRIEDAYLRVRLRSAPNKACDIRIDHPAAAIDGPGQRVVCSPWRPLPAPDNADVLRETVGKTGGKLVVRVFDEDGDPAPKVALFCSSAPDPALTDEAGRAEFDVELGPGTVEVARTHLRRVPAPWTFAFEATTPETHVAIRHRPLRPVVVRVAPEDPVAELNPKDVEVRVFTEGAPRIVCRTSEVEHEPEATGVGTYRFAAPDDVDVLVELRYFGTTQVVRLPPKAVLAEFRVGPVHPVRWSVPRFPARVELRLSFAAIAGGRPTLEFLHLQRPGRGDAASGEVRLPPGRYRASLRADLYDRDGEDFFVDHERIVDVTPDRPAAVDFGP
jgi:hypothetical protein